ncbi:MULTISPECIES: NADPH-dependent FMN reductase [unclassified Variovorax]|uniref:NADPH-dependent FMN reductase n=1 Tax=unclassified Variovorax TaxID=663243 RepID=UPI00210B5A88|nr:MULTISPECIES: NADPH-dependent FMN reductase [unclassified Variovorax]
MSTLDIVGLCGSLRAASLNRMVLKLAASSMPQGMAMEVVEWRDVPPFDADLLAAQGMPPQVAALRERIRRADGVVIATPEYNFSIPGMLKNAIDWISRGEDQPFSQMPVALLSATPGPRGGAGVQYDLRKVLLYVNAMTLVKPEVFVGDAAAKFDAAGLCTDESTRRVVTGQMEAFAKWIAAVQRMN